MITARVFHLLTSIFATATATASSCHPQLTVPRYERVVLVHGIFEDGYAFHALKRRLETHGIRCYVPRLVPADARCGLEKLAENLKEDIDREFGGEEPFAMVAFSMGGLVSRYYLQQLGGAERCQAFITVSSPHHGTVVAHFLPNKGARQMRPGSDFLRSLEATEERLRDIPIVSYRTPMDLIILPTTSSVWERAENRCHSVALHPLMLHSKTILDDIERRFVQAEE